MQDKKPVIALISAPDELLLRYFKTHHLAVNPPLGLAYLAAYVRDKCEKVYLLDGNALGLGLEEIARRVKETRPDIVGISVYTSIAKTCYRLANLIKAVSDDIVIVAGGPHVHFVTQDFLKECPAFDYIVRAEGEETFGELIDFLIKGKDPSGVKGITYRDRATGRIISTADRPFISDLDKLPLPAYDLLPMERYSAPQVLNGARPFSIIMTSRGCPFGCDYCCSTVAWGKIQRRRSPENVVKEIEMLYERYKIKALRFEDDLFTLKKEWATEVCEGMIKKGLNYICWEANGRIGTFDDALLKKMKQAGCVSLSFGIEFGNQHILDQCKKGFKVQDVMPAVQRIKKAGLKAKGYFMIGYPTETAETIQDTIRLSKECGVDYALFSLVTPFPGSALFDYLDKNGLLLHKDWEYYQMGFVGPRPFKIPAVSEDKLIKLYNKAVREFHLMPSRIFKYFMNHPSLMLRMALERLGSLARRKELAHG